MTVIEESILFNMLTLTSETNSSFVFLKFNLGVYEDVKSSLGNNLDCTLLSFTVTNPWKKLK